MNSWEQIPLINDKIVERVTNGDYGTITLNEVIIGKKARSNRMKPPLVWIVPDRSPMDDIGESINELLRLRYILIGAFSSYDPPEAKAKSEEIALRACLELFKNEAGTDEDRTLDGLVDDIIRTAFIPGHERLTDDGTLYGAAVEVEVRFQLREEI